MIFFCFANLEWCCNGLASNAFFGCKSIFFSYLWHSVNYQGNPNRANALNLEMRPWNVWEQDYLRSPVLDAGGKTSGPRQNLGTKYELETICTYSCGTGSRTWVHWCRVFSLNFWWGRTQFFPSPSVPIGDKVKWGREGTYQKFPAEAKISP